MKNSATAAVEQADQSISKAPNDTKAAEVILSADQVRNASHPAILRAIEDILRDGDNNASFSNFYSHQSFGNISDGNE